MKILVFSDTHLSCNFDEGKYRYLVKIINKADRVIINGDFWDSWFISFDNFVLSQWRGLFPLLLSKQAVYIYGNHDPKDKTDDRVSLFSKMAVEKYSIGSGENNYEFEHGDKILKNKRSILVEGYGKVLMIINQTRWVNIVYRFIHLVEAAGFKILGPVRMTGSYISKNNNTIHKHKNEQKNWLVYGDTHCAEVDRTYMYANSGCIVHGIGSYLLIEDGEIREYKERY